MTEKVPAVDPRFVSRGGVSSNPLGAGQPVLAFAITKLSFASISSIFLVARKGLKGVGVVYRRPTSWWRILVTAPHPTAKGRPPAWRVFA